MNAQHQQSTHGVERFANVAEKLVWSLLELSSGLKLESELDLGLESELDCEEAFISVPLWLSTLLASALDAGSGANALISSQEYTPVFL